MLPLLQFKDIQVLLLMKTVDATVGSDLQIQMEANVNESEIINIIKEYADSDVTPLATTVPQLALSDELGGESLQTYVLLESGDGVLKWRNKYFR